ncbi:Crp/Fnr family transcriptional regulator [Mucilaginibacter endophyticus]|uniref:Crp/Fnr family transcriptional regulator n=1 Tax=Mucilaginibacter endophyticus TaxID=2675003 RepID=UPI000E0D6397|nr:cyclic nucleotide-binding domain-containing protein [Mucilaginibacter endophyticus]
MKKHHTLTLKLFKKLDSLVPLDEKIRDFLYEHITGEYYPHDEVLLQPKDKSKDVYYLSSGTAVLYIFDTSGDKQVLEIYQADDIIFNVSHILQQPPGCYLSACGDSYLLKITYEIVLELNRRFPETDELSRKVVAGKELKNLWRNKILIMPGIKKVEAFYKQYPELLPPGRVMRDTELASFLLLAEGSLRALRNRLLQSGVLKTDN